jgi:chloramphenicol-sensitive protein RarD
MNNLSHAGRGIAWGLLAFLTWGFVPIYWKLLHGIPFLEVLGHRIVWSAAILAIVLFFQSDLKGFKGIITNKQNVLYLVPTTILILFNWNLFIWAVDNNYIVECSLGYFINPLLNVFLGVFFLKEKLKPMQWLSVALAFVGIIVMMVSKSGRPEISLGLALSFGLYGLLKKKMKVSPIHSLFFEAASLVVPTLLYFSILLSKGNFAFMNGTNTERLLMIGGGAVTVIPLLSFGFAVRYLPLTTVGIMQYITPTLQLMCGVFLYNETFTSTHAYSFGLIWSGLIIYTLHGLMSYRKQFKV